MWFHRGEFATKRATPSSLFLYTTRYTSIEIQWKFIKSLWPLAIGFLADVPLVWSPGQVDVTDVTLVWSPLADVTLVLFVHLAKWKRFSLVTRTPLTRAESQSRLSSSIRYLGKSFNYKYVNVGPCKLTKFSQTSLPCRWRVDPS